MGGGKVSGEICEKRLAAKAKGNVYGRVVLYSLETVAPTKDRGRVEILCVRDKDGLD